MHAPWAAHCMDAHDAGRELDVKQRALRESAAHDTAEGPYFLGEALSLVEIALVPFLDRLSVCLQHYRNFDMSYNKNQSLILELGI